MLDQTTVDQWLAELLERLRHAFGERLLFVGHHGSWARGEARPDSDIDTIVILDRIESQDLTIYREVIAAMPNARSVASGFLGSFSELQVWPRSELIQCFYGCKVLYGTLDGIVEKPTESDFVEDIRIKASANLHAARHYLLYPHELSEVVHKLYYRFKDCFYALQSWMVVYHGRFFTRKVDLLEVLSDTDDREVVRVARDWGKLEEDWGARPLYYVELLERWSRKMVSRLAAYGTNKPDNPK